MHNSRAVRNIALLVLTACGSAAGGTGPAPGGPGGPSGPPVVSGGHLTTITASGSGVIPYFFSPVPDTVAVGTVVTFHFLDVTHTVTFNQAVGAPADIPPTSNADSTRVFATAGTFTYMCSIHQYMMGTVVVQ